MLGANVEFFVRGRDAAALFQEFRGAGSEQLQPFAGDQTFSGEEATREIEFALRLAQHARFSVEDGFGCHAVMLGPRAP